MGALALLPTLISSSTPLLFNVTSTQLLFSSRPHSASHLLLTLLTLLSSRDASPQHTAGSRADGAAVARKLAMEAEAFVAERRVLLLRMAAMRNRVDALKRLNDHNRMPEVYRQSALTDKGG